MMAACRIHDFDQLPLVLNVNDLMDALGLGRGTIYEYLRSGKIRSVKVGRKILIPKDALLDFLS